MGTIWTVKIWDHISEENFEYLRKNIIDKTRQFDELYSRFISDSFILKLHKPGDPDTSNSPKDILATWVIAENTTLADGLATSLFLVPPELLLNHFDFEYFILNTKLQVKRSLHFDAELY
ncbi:hypothetical protein A3G65_02935 [Candidatus Roizmanbacteria bacterium RIFCSPLOWO2_12_FULL_37_7b]|nr:MAG: hypothetical protein A3G65_02935 [Candidatus Roizmanbacteria bacterium RIFCSPLOWO2_12_FULL_37_7b]